MAGAGARSRRNLIAKQFLSSNCLNGLFRAVPEAHSSRAIVLRWRPYGESDKIATLLTESAGKLTGIAKGARRSRRRFPNSLEPLARVRVEYRRRPGAGLAFLESCTLLESTVPLTEPIRFAYGSYLAELVDQLTAEEDPAPQVFALLDEALAELGRGPATAAFLRAFELKLLARVGFDPQLERCARCGRAWGEAESALLDLAHGNAICAGCRRAEEATIPVDPVLRTRLAELAGLPLAACRAEPFGPLVRAAADLSGHLLSLHLPRPLRSVKLIERL